MLVSVWVCVCVYTFTRLVVHLFSSRTYLAKTDTVVVGGVGGYTRWIWVWLLPLRGAADPTCFIFTSFPREVITPRFVPGRLEAGRVVGQLCGLQVSAQKCAWIQYPPPHLQLGSGWPGEGGLDALIPAGFWIVDVDRSGDRDELLGAEIRRARMWAATLQADIRLEWTTTPRTAWWGGDSSAYRYLQVSLISWPCGSHGNGQEGCWWCLNHSW